MRDGCRWRRVHGELLPLSAQDYRGGRHEGISPPRCGVRVGREGCAVGAKWQSSGIWPATTRKRTAISSRCKVQAKAAARKRGCHGHTVERPQREQPQADHCRSNRRSRPQDGGAHRHQAPSGKPDPRLEAEVDHSGGTRQLRRSRAAVILRIRAATAHRRRRTGSSRWGLSDQLSDDPGSRACTPADVDRRCSKSAGVMRQVAGRGPGRRHRSAGRTAHHFPGRPAYVRASGLGDHEGPTVLQPVCSYPRPTPLTITYADQGTIPGRRRPLCVRAHRAWSTDGGRKNPRTGAVGAVIPTVCPASCL